VKSRHASFISFALKKNQQIFKGMGLISLLQQHCIRTSFKTYCIYSHISRLKKNYQIGESAYTHINLTSRKRTDMATLLRSRNITDITIQSYIQPKNWDCTKES